MDIIYGIMAAFGGGILGATLGALPMFIMTGFIGFIGAAMQMSNSNMAEMFSGDIIFGALTGPQVAFAGGVAAAAFAAHRLELLEAGSDIITPLFKFKSTSTIIIGGVFGVIGFLATNGLAAAGYPGNGVALSVIITGGIVRLMLGHRGIATKRSVKEREIEELRKARKEKIGFLHMDDLRMNFVIALGLGMIFSFVSLKTGVVELGFYFSAASLVLLQFGYSIPLTHHITLTCSIAAAATGSIWIGIIFAVIAWFIGDLWEKYVNARDDTWWDTPSASIAICSLIMLML